MNINFQQKLIVLTTIIGLVTIFAWMMIIKPEPGTHCLTPLAFNAVAALFLGGNLFWMHSDKNANDLEVATAVSVVYAVATFIVTFVTFINDSSKWSYTNYLMINFTILAIALIGYFIAVAHSD